MQSMRTGSRGREPVEHFSEHELDVLLWLADELVPHAFMDAEGLVRAAGAAIQLLDAGGVADFILGAVRDEQRQRHLLEAPLQLAAHAQQLQRRRCPRPCNRAPGACQGQLPLPLHLEGEVRDGPPCRHDLPRRHHRRDDPE